MKTITFYSYKGGVGRTLALSNIAKRLNEFGKKVFIIDFDLEAPGIHYKFKDFLRYDNIKEGLVDYIYEFCINGNVDSDIKKYVRSFKINNRSRSSINLMCAGNNYSSSYWQKLSTISWNELFYKKGSEGIEFFLNLKQIIQKKYNPDFLLIDSRTGFTETSAITMSIMANEVLIFSANNTENIEGSKQVIKSINKTQSLTNDKIKAHFILTRIPGGDNPEDKMVKNKIIQQVDHQLNFDSPTGNKFVDSIHTIHIDRDLEIKETLKIGADQKPNAISISNDYFNLLKVISNFSQKEIDKYNSILKSDQIYFKALGMPKDEFFKNEMEKALKFNENNVDALLQLSHYCYLNLLIDDDTNYLAKALLIEPNNSFILSRLGAHLVTKYHFSKNLTDVEKGREYLKTAIEINTENKKVDVIIEVIFVNSFKFTDTYSVMKHKDMIEGLLAKYPNSLVVFNSLAVFYHEIGELENAYHYIYKALEQDNSKGLFMTTLAEIHSKANKMNEFYYNIDLAIKAGYNIEGFFYYPEFYNDYFKDEKFLLILEKYNLIDKFKILLNRYYKLIGK